METKKNSLRTKLMHLMDYNYQSLGVRLNACAIPDFRCLEANWLTAYALTLQFIFHVELWALKVSYVFG